MNFQNANLLTRLIPLVALPLVIHLLNRIFPRLFAFSPLTYIRESVSRHSWFFRERHLIMALVRAAFLLLLLLSFLKPVMSNLAPSPADKPGVHAPLALKNSLGGQDKLSSETQPADSAAGHSDYKAAIHCRPLFHYFILAALLLLMVENGLQLLLKKLVTP